MAMSPARSLRRAADSGQPLPEIPALQELYTLMGGGPRLGQLIMIAGRPGAQKSGFALWLTAQWGLPTLYMSGDMSEHTISSRLAAMTSGLTTNQVSEIIGSDDPVDQFESERLAVSLQASKLAFCCTAEPSLDDIDAEINAWVELHDEYPPVIVVDNLMDVEPISDAPYESHKGILKELQVLCRETGSTVVVTHHMNEVTKGDIGMPLPASGVAGKVTQSVELALSVALDSGGNGEKIPFRVSPVKNRAGKGYPDASRYAEMAADPSRNIFTMKSFHPQVPMKWNADGQQV